MAVISKDLGAVTAYAAAVNRGYTGTKEEFETLMASYAYVGEQAAESAQSASSSAQGASQAASSANNAMNNARTAESNAQSAASGAQGYAQSAQQSAQSASQFAQTAESAKNTAVNAVNGFAAGAQQALDSVNQAGNNWKSLAEAQKLDSEAWAVGQRDGEDVGSSDPAYYNNAKYYAEQGGLSAQTATEAAQTATQKASEAQASASAAAESARTLTIDPTLTKEGQAADAKKTGDKITSLKEDLNSAIEHVNANFVYPTNRLNPNTFTAPGYVIDLTNGSVTAYGSELCVSDYIPIEAGITYTSTMRTAYYGSGTKFPVYDENKNFVKSISPDSMDTDNNRATFTSDIYGYTRVVVYKTRITDTMFVVGDTYPDEFIPYSSIIHLDDDIHIDAQNVDGLNDVLESTGVFDQVPASNILQLTPENKYVGITGALIDGAYHATIENVVPGDKYTLKCQTGSAVRAYIIVDSGGNVIRYADADTWTTDHDYDITVTIAPNEAGATLYINTIVSSYLGAYYEHTVVVIDGNKNIGYGYLFGKMIAVDGDSICKGEGYSGGYAKIIAERYSMGYQNLGVSGGTIAAGTQSGGNDRHWICRSVQNLSSDADYIIVEGGVNDASLNVPMGTITNGYNDTLDDTTFCGAMESICKQLVNDFAGKKIGYIAVHQMTDKYRNTNTDLSTSYYLAALKICQKWGVPVCDLNISVPPFAYLGSDIKNAYTYNGDGWHPNEVGYKKYYVDKITSFLEAL